MAESDDEDGFGGFGDDAADIDKAATVDEGGWAADFGGESDSKADQEEAKDVVVGDAGEVKADEKDDNDANKES